MSNDPPPIPKGATGRDYEIFNHTIYQIMALDALVTLLDDALDSRGMSEQERSDLMDQLVREIQALGVAVGAGTPPPGEEVRQEHDKVVSVLRSRHSYVEGPVEASPANRTWDWQCIRCDDFPANVRQGCRNCGLGGWLKRVPA